jgi:hypothetical protein
VRLAGMGAVLACAVPMRVVGWLWGCVAWMALGWRVVRGVVRSYGLVPPMSVACSLSAPRHKKPHTNRVQGMRRWGVSPCCILGRQNQSTRLGLIANP